MRCHSGRAVVFARITLHSRIKDKFPRDETRQDSRYIDHRHCAASVVASFPHIKQAIEVEGMGLVQDKDFGRLGLGWISPRGC